MIAVYIVITKVCLSFVLEQHPHFRGSVREIYTHRHLKMFYRLKLEKLEKKTYFGVDHLRLENLLKQV